MQELLSPSGSPESFYAAIMSGANAVYLGLDDFSARKNAENFSRENLKTYLDHAHLFGVKVYVALNTLVRDDELKKFFDYVGFCNDVGVDGVILQSVFLGKILHAAYPDLPLHLSTQAGVNNVDGAIFAKEYGFSRVVLSRETPLEEIEKISAVIETECFVQGALCTAFSGQCYLSGFAGNMSGNRGLCKQPCRKRYTLKNGKETRSGYLFSLSDLSVSHKIKEYIAAGVSSFKIEGRMRKPSFVAAATAYYRAILDGKTPSISPLKRTFNRGDYTAGLAFGQDKNFISDKVQSHKGEYIGSITAVKKGCVTVSGNHAFISGDGAKVLRKGSEVGSLFFDGCKLKSSGDVSIGDEVFITTDVACENDLLSAKKTIPVSVKATLLCGKPAELTASCNGVFVSAKGEPPEKAENTPLSEARITDILSKTDKMPFSVSASVETDGVFLPTSKLNALRRELYDKLFSALTVTKSRRNNDIKLPEDVLPDSSKGVVVLDDTFEFSLPIRVDHAVLCPADYADNRVIDGFIRKSDEHIVFKYLYIPNKFSSQDELSIKRFLPLFDGFYVEGVHGINLAARYGKKLILGTGANVYDGVSAAVANKLANGVCLSKELSVSQAKDLCGYYYSAGSIKVMDLLYCPFKKTCADCDRKDISEVSDGERNFFLRRVKLNGCRFELYNGSYLVTANDKRPIVNLIGVKSQIKSLVLSRLGDKRALKEILSPFTSGHENKPLI